MYGAAGQPRIEVLSCQGLDPSNLCHGLRPYEGGTEYSIVRPTQVQRTCLHTCSEPSLTISQVGLCLTSQQSTTAKTNIGDACVLLERLQNVFVGIRRCCMQGCLMKAHLVMAPCFFRLATNSSLLEASSRSSMAPPPIRRRKCCRGRRCSRPPPPGRLGASSCKKQMAGVQAGLAGVAAPDAAFAHFSWGQAEAPVWHLSDKPGSRADTACPVRLQGSFYASQLRQGLWRLCQRARVDLLWSSLGIRDGRSGCRLTLYANSSKDWPDACAMACPCQSIWFKP